MKYLILAALLLSGCTYGPQTTTENSFEQRSKHTYNGDKVKVVTKTSTTKKITKEAEFKELSIIDGTDECLWGEDRGSKLDTILFSLFELQFMECIL